MIHIFNIDDAECYILFAIYTLKKFRQLILVGFLASVSKKQRYSIFNLKKIYIYTCLWFFNKVLVDSARRFKSELNI